MDIPALYDIYIQHPIVTTDSRNCPAGSIFFALKGDKFNGNRFALNALQQGCAYAVVDEFDEAFEGNDHIIVVDNVLESLQKLANYHRRKLKIPIIGITAPMAKPLLRNWFRPFFRKSLRWLSRREISIITSVCRSLFCR
jgi:UDP-N-acetylmuramoyl-tripeptide--D-alanyl-D-alanine ligase